MKNNTHPKYTKPPILFLSILLFFALVFIQSCTSKEKQTKQWNTNSVEIDPAIDFNLLARLNESNLKIIETTNLILEQTKVKLPKSLLLKIKNDHAAIQDKLKKLTEENLIITQKPIYNLELNEEIIKNDTNGKFALHILEKSIQTQISTFQKIEKKYSNEEFQLFANQSIPVLEENQKILSQLENN